MKRFDSYASALSVLKTAHEQDLANEFIQGGVIVVQQGEIANHSGCQHADEQGYVEAHAAEDGGSLPLASIVTILLKRLPANRLLNSSATLYIRFGSS